MKRIIILFLLLLTACAPVMGAPTADPYLDLLVAQAQITGTAQAQQVQIIGWTATAQSWTATPSPMPTSTPVPSVTPTPTINVTMTLAVEKMNQEIADMQRENVRKDATNTVLAWLPYLVFALAIGLALFFGYVGVKRFSMMANPVHEGTGKPMPTINVLEGVVLDIDRAPNGMAVMNRAYVASLPLITAERQAVVTNAAQLVDAQSRRARLPRELVQAQSRPMLEAPSQVSAMNDAGAFPLPAWSSVGQWSPVKDNLPLGVSASGLQMWDLNIQAHLAVFGMTRSGKDQRMMRPLVAFMLASGQQVLLIGKEIDFLPHLGHPNLVFVPVHDVTEPEEAAKYANALAACVAEKNNRIKFMAQRGVALWDGPRTFVVLGELSNAMKEMESGMADYAMSKTTSVVNEGGKAGMNLVFSAQRPKGFRDLTTQCGRVVFQVETDEERGYALGMKDAYKLPEVPTGYFYRKWHGLQTLGGFQPSDDEIREFLGRHTVQAMPKPDWIDGKFIEPTPQAPLIAPRTDLEALAESYLSEYQPGMSGQAIGRMIGKPYGGSWKDKIDQLREVFDRLSGQHQISEGVV